jgi:hypothetical protein
MSEENVSICTPISCPKSHNQRKVSDFVGLKTKSQDNNFSVAGETWVPDMPVYDGKSGLVDWAVGVYDFSFVILVNWTLIQVFVCVTVNLRVSEIEIDF